MTVASDVPRTVSGGWYGAELANNPGSWRISLTADVRDDLLRAAAEVGPGGIGADPNQERPRVSERTLALAGELYRRLSGEPGLAVLSGFPVQEEPELTETAYLVLAALIGQPVLQTLDGNLIVRVEVYDRGVKVPGAQKTGIPASLPYHIDRATDLIGLLCVRSARVGGLSLLVSSKTVNNVMYERHPDLLPVLYQPYPVHVPPMRAPEGERPATWCEAPLLTTVDGDFAAYCDRSIVEQTQQFPDAPRLTERQVAALDAVMEVAELPGMHLEMALEPGDLQLINNWTVLHSRTAYEDEDPGRGRLLHRLHLAFAGSPALHTGFTPVYGATRAGGYRGGLWRTAEVQSRMGTPVNAP